MGTVQSSEHPPAPVSIDKPTSPASEENTIVSYHDATEASLSGMDLVHYKCRKRKHVYNKCVSDWYTKEFMTGKNMHQEEVCGEKFEAYRTCILKGIKKEIWDKKGLPPPKEGSMLAEVE